MLAAWHSGDVRTVSAAAVATVCRQSGLDRKLAAFERGAEKGAVSLLAAFYMRQAGFTTAGEHTFEFTHISFGQYLVAQRVIRAIQTLARQFNARDIDADAGWDERTALMHLAEITGPSPLNSEILSFIQREIFRIEQRIIIEWQRRLSMLLTFVCRHDWPMERFSETFLEQRRRARNAEEALLAVHHACAVHTKRVSDVYWSTPTAAADLVYRLNHGRLRPGDVIGLSCLGFLNLSSQEFSFADLYNVNLAGSNLSYVNFVGATLENANLRAANLAHANLNRANLTYADLSHINLEGVDLRGASLDATSLSGASLSGALFDNIWIPVK